MPYKVNNKGSLVPDASVITWQSGSTMLGIGAGNKAVYKTTLGKIEVLDGNEDPTIEFVGITDGTAVPAGGTVNYMPVGGFIDPLTTSFAVSQVELWAKEDGSLVDFSGVGSGKWTRRVGVLVEPGSTKLEVVAGEHIYKQ